ncbi:MAG: SDR family oxidoreductase [Burkholderiaceae bacterium]|nr:SDR family oxidoreductase [Burkholderiaceae bacterium]
MSQRVLVTAGASGIGREIARAFAASGARVFVCDIDEAALAALVTDSPGIGTTRCDVSKRAENERMVAAALQWLGGLDVLVNNAGIAGPTVPVDEVPPDEWDRVVQVNLTAAFDVTRLSIPALKQSTAGVVIVMSSAAGRFGYPNRVAYAATKWGLVGFTKTLAMELGPFGIRANAILPGTVAGDRIQRVFEGRAKLSGKSIDEVRDASMRNQSLQTLVDPKDIASLAVFLASDAGKSISGQALAIDNDIQRL